MWYGAEITLGSVALLGLLTHPHMAPPPPPYVVYSPPPEPYYYPPHLPHLNMFQATGKQLVNGSQEPGKESGSLAIMIDGGIGWQDIMKIAKPLDIMWREGFGSRGVAWITEDSLIKRREL
jgi:hypothetical protein